MKFRDQLRGFTVSFRRKSVRCLSVASLTAGICVFGAPVPSAQAVAVSTVTFAGQAQAPTFNGGQAGNNGLFLDPAGQYLYGVTFNYILKINLSSYVSESIVDFSNANYSSHVIETSATNTALSKAYVAGYGDDGKSYLRSVTTATGLADPTMIELAASPHLRLQDMAVVNVPNVGPVAYITSSGSSFYNIPSTLYIVNLTTNVVTTLNMETMGFDRGQASWAAASSDGTKVYLSTQNNGIHVLNTSDNSVARIIAGTGGLVATSATGHILYSIPFINANTPSTLKIIDTANADATTNHPLGGLAQSISVGSNGDVAIGMRQAFVNYWDASASTLVPTQIPNAQSDTNSIGIHIDENQAYGNCLFTSDNYTASFTAFSIDGADCGPFNQRFSNASASLAIGSTASISALVPTQSDRESPWVAIAVFKDTTRIRLITPPLPSQVLTEYAEAGGAVDLTYRAYNAVNLTASNVASVNDINFNTLFRETHTLPIEYKNFNATQLSTFRDYSCGITSGVVYCWGANGDGQLGDGTTTRRLIATRVVDGTDGFTNENVTSVFTGHSHTCAVKAGSMWCWGRNGNGQLGDGTTTSSSTPIKVDDVANVFTNTGVTSVALNSGTTCAVASSKVYCWGADSSGELGNGLSTGDSPTPAAVVNVSGGFTNASVTHVTAGVQHFCAISSGVAHCWGNNGSGRLGDGTTTAAQEPVLVLNGSAGFTNANVTTIDAGEASTCAISSGAVYCWGENGDRQLGDGTGTDSYQPMKVADVNNGFTNSGVTAVSVGYLHACAISNGVLYCWGDNDERQIGNGTSNRADTATRVSDVNNGFTNSGNTVVAAGEELSCVVNSSGTYCWGNGDDGRIGNGRTGGASTARGVCCEQTASQNNVQENATQPNSGNTPSASNPAGGSSASNNVLVETDKKVYRRLPRRVSDYSSFNVLTRAESMRWDIESATPGTCVGTRTDLVMLGEGRCIARIVAERTNRVIRTLRTNVVDTDVSVLQVGNETYVQSPIYFANGSRFMRPGSAKALAEVSALASQASAIVVAGHTGSLFGNEESNAILSERRSQTVIAALRARKVRGPFAIAAVGDSDPATTRRSEAAQNRNRRVVVVLIP